MKKIEEVISNLEKAFPWKRRCLFSACLYRSLIFVIEGSVNGGEKNKYGMMWENNLPE
jgi:hypothetical protein